MMIKNLRALLLASAASVCAVSYASAEEILNGGFETLDADPGILFENWVDGSAIFSTAFPFAGSEAAASTCDGVACVSIAGDGTVSGNGVVYQNVTLAPGVYRLTYQLENSDAASVYFRSSVGARQTELITSAGSFAYRPTTAITAVSGGLTQVAFAMTQDSGFLRVDEVSLVMVDDGLGNALAAASQTMAQTASFGFLDRLQNRFGHSGSPVQVANIREIQTASRDGSAYFGQGRYRAFIGGYGDRGKWDSGDTRNRRWGLNAGVEMAVADGLDMGVALAAGENRFRTDTLFTDNRAEANEYLGAIYAHWGPSSVPVYLTGAIGYGIANTDFKRTSTMGLGKAAAFDVDVQQWFGSLEFGYDWKLSSMLTLTPYARGDGAMIEHEGYTETLFAGATLLPATVTEQELDAIRTILGLRGTFDLNVGRRGAKLTANAGWAHEFETDRIVGFSHTTTPVTFIGTASAGIPEEDSVVAGANVEVPVTDQARFYFGYNGGFASGQDIHAGEAGIRVTW